MPVNPAMTPEDARGIALALAAGAGDRAALAEFIAQMQPHVWRFCAHLTHPGAADDLTQDTFLRAITSLPGFRGESSARSWLLTIARRVVADRVRHDLARPRTVGEEAIEEQPAVDDATGVVEVQQLLASLPQEQREALVLTQVTGLSYAEAAAVMEVPIGTIRSRVARARAALTALREADAAEAADWPAQRRVG